MGALLVSLVAAFAAVEVLRRRRDARHARTLTSAAQALALGDLTEHPLPPTVAGTALALVRDGQARLHRERDRTTAERERRADVAFRRRREAEEQTRTRAQTMLDATAELVLEELGGVRAEVEAVRAAAGSIDAQAGTVDDVARDVVTRSRETTEGARTLIAHLNEVGGVVAVIAAVADQTRLLALNATIEAVRAGEAGRSFAVVASEVKDLATTTARSTEQISATIADLERIADRVAASLGVMTDGVTGLDDSTHALAGVASSQQSAVGRLEQAVAAAVRRIEDLGRLDEVLERPSGGRVRVSLPAVLRRGEGHEEVTVEDLATGGVGLRLRPGSATAAGDDVVLEISLDSHPCRLPGTVKVARPDGTAGVAFGDLPPDARDAVENVIAAQAAPSAR